jgi:AcrR family transcriptional regulator
MKNIGARPISTSREPATEEKPQRINDPEQTRHDIMAVATQEFADKGLSGARIDEIAARTRTSKRMIYYYFGSKEGLYIEVLEEAYRNIRNIERDLNVERLSPEQALRQLVGFTFDRHQQNPAFVRLVMNENLHSGKYIAQSKNIPTLNVPAIDTIRQIVERGRKTGAFRKDVDPTDLHMSISALCFYSVSNRHTFSTIFKVDMTTPKALAARKKSIVATILAAVRPV